MQSDNLVIAFNSRYIHTGNENDKVSFISILSYLSEIVDNNGNKYKIEFINNPLKFRKWMKENEIDSDPKLKEIKENSLYKYNVQETGYYLFMYKDIGHIQKYDRNKRSITINTYEDDESIESDKDSVAKSVAIIADSVNDLKRMVLSNNESVFSLTNEVKSIKNPVYTEQLGNMSKRIERLHEKINPLSSSIDDMHIYFAYTQKELQKVKKENEDLRKQNKELKSQYNADIELIDYIYRNPDSFIKDLANKHNMQISDVIVAISEKMGII